MLGPRVEWEMLRGLERRAPGTRALIEWKVLRYAERLTPELVTVTGADEFLSLPLHRVGRCCR
jgi:hypothetical protein